jgi:hypothetical protein
LELEQLEQPELLPELPDEEDSPLLRCAKTDICFCSFSLLHSGHRGLLLPMTRASNSLPQERQTKSNKGIRFSPNYIKNLIMTAPYQGFTPGKTIEILPGPLTNTQYILIGELSSSFCTKKTFTGKSCSRKHSLTLLSFCYFLQGTAVISGQRRENKKSAAGKNLQPRSVKKILGKFFHDCF